MIGRNPLHILCLFVACLFCCNSAEITENQGLATVRVQDTCFWYPTFFDNYSFQSGIVEKDSWNIEDKFCPLSNKTILAELQNKFNAEKVFRYAEIELFEPRRKYDVYYLYKEAAFESIVLRGISGQFFILALVGGDGGGFSRISAFFRNDTILEKTYLQGYYSLTSPDTMHITKKVVSQIEITEEAISENPIDSMFNLIEVLE